MKETLSYGEDILISGFGKFRVKQKAERKGRKPNFRVIYRLTESFVSVKNRKVEKIKR